MRANLIQSLQEIRDFRASQGRRYSLWLILLLVVMGTISGGSVNIYYEILNKQKQFFYIEKNNARKPSFT